ncbi:MAG TPA: DUF4349 domain-containing protein [Nocardioides sp.]|nr:DUF4349 domain-containing protein [Nocardioides sp.]
MSAAADAGAGDSAARSAGGAVGAIGEGESAPQRAPAANRTLVEVRAVIRTGDVSLTSPDLDRARAEVDAVLAGLDGVVENESTSHDDQGDIAQSTLVLRVPVTRFKDAMTALEAIGKTQSSSTSSDDVTTEVIDVDERVETLQNSLDRLQSYQAKAKDIEDLLRYEEQITQREAELQSLEAQQSYLSDQTSMSTITLTMSTPPEIIGPPDALDDAGFLAGLRSGWNALTGAGIVLLTVVGAVLPFAAVLALVGLPVWLLVRRVLRGRAATPPPPPAPSA